MMIWQWPEFPSAASTSETPFGATATARFRFVEDVDALTLAALFEEAQKASPCECERKSGGGPLSGSRAASSKYLAREKNLSRW
jgi:hypothetical protein